MYDPNARRKPFLCECGEEPRPGANRKRMSCPRCYAIENAYSMRDGYAKPEPRESGHPLHLLRKAHTTNYLFTDKPILLPDALARLEAFLISRLTV